MISPVNEAALEVGAMLLSTPDTTARASIIASAIVTQLPNCACAVHRFIHEDNENAWTVIGLAGDISPSPEMAGSGNRLMAPLVLESPEILVYTSADILREDYAHLSITRSVSSIAYVPLLMEEELAGVVEILFFSGTPRVQDFEAIAPVIQLAPVAILAAESADAQRQDLLDSVHRMSQLYDLEKSLNATLEMEAVTALIPEKAAAMLPCQAMHLWMFDGEILRLISTHGSDETVEAGMTQSPGQGYVADMAEEGETLLIAEADDERLASRNVNLAAESGAAPVTNALLVPLMQDDAEIGVLEAINKEDGVFDDDDQFLMMSMAETIASALKNASLVLAERKLEILKALVHVSGEITSTLRLDRLLGIIVNSPQNVLPYERCAVALDQRGKLQLKSVSGLAALPLGDITVERLNQLMRWLSSQTELLYLRQNEEGGNSNTDLPAPVAEYFAATGFRGLFAIQLADDQGRLGVLTYESGNPDFLDVPHVEMIKILAGQATVAIRNALLYREVPLISILEPLVRKKRALFNSRRRRWMTFGIVLECALFLSFCPLPMRLAGDVVVAPQHLVTIAAPVDGNVTAVYAREGQRVTTGQVLGAMNDWQWRADLASTEARYQQAMLVMQNDLAHGAAQSGSDREQAEFLHAEMERARTRVDDAQLRSPIDGIIVTPALGNTAGKHLVAGDAFAQVLDLSTAVVLVSIPERDTELMSPGESVAIKLDSYPQRTWRGTVSVVSPEAKAGDGERTFTAVVPLSNVDASLRAGMTGRGKISLGWKPAGYVMLRRPALWIWQTLWNWIGW
ncbi:MAG TPA: efflux RND transporter periplasmic adaptor subunit [Terracidiphilus sp.]|nr:efflux RND transporter periplasmic adaptor subunit [Terracidiphilus sp.]